MLSLLRALIAVSAVGCVVCITAASLVLAAGDGDDGTQASARAPAGSDGDAPGEPPSAATRSGAALPAPAARLPTTAPGLAAALQQTTRRLRRAIDGWRPASSRARLPAAIELLALHHQRLIFRLVGRPRTARRAIARLAPDVRGEVRDTVAARRALEQVGSSGEPPRRRPKIRTGPPRPPGELRRLYRQAQRRFGVRWQLLAAINLVETAFGRLRNLSVAGARGPMQFMPATWQAYGLGGDVERPRDAIMGAANYLRASGAGSDEARALFAYNRSTAYVRAVRLHARRIARDPRHFVTLYAWQVYIRRDGHVRRITGPGIDDRR